MSSGHDIPNRQHNTSPTHSSSRIRRSTVLSGKKKKRKARGPVNRRVRHFVDPRYLMSSGWIIGSNGAFNTKHIAFFTDLNLLGERARVKTLEVLRKSPNFINSRGKKTSTLIVKAGRTTHNL